MLAQPLRKPALPALEPLPDLDFNRRRRQQITEECERDPVFRKAMYERCKSDFKFWVNHWGWAFDDHAQGAKKIQPLVMWRFQEAMAMTMVENIQACLDDPTKNWNAGADKARRMTATSTALLVVLWFALFHGVSTGITSKNLDEVDIQGNLNTPFERLRRQIEILWKIAPWQFPEKFKISDKKQYKSKLINFQNGGQITGMAPTEKAMRQGRYFIWLGDEFAFVNEDYGVWQGSSGAVRVRLIFSTPNGPFCKFYRLVFKKDNEQFHLFELDWWKHPVNAIGLFIKPDGTYSSPFFEGILANNSRQVVAREWLRDHNDSVGGIILQMFRYEESVVTDLLPDPRVRSIYCVLDPGSTVFAGLFCQKDSHGRRLLLHEVLNEAENCPRSTTLLRWTADRVKQIAEERFADWEIIFIGDPYGSRKNASNVALSEYDELWKIYKIRVQSAYLNKIPQREQARILELQDLMASDVELDDGSQTPALLVDEKHCPLTLHAIKTGYRRVVLPNGEVTEEVRESHPDNDLIDCAGMFALKAKDGYGSTEGNVIKVKKQHAEWRRTQSRIHMNTGRNRYA